MTETITQEKLAVELKAIRENLAYIREHIVDIDMFLSPEEEEKLEESLKEYREKKAVPLDDFEKEMNKQNV